MSNGYINFKWNVVTEQDTINVSINAYQDNYYNNRGGANIWKDSSAIKSGTASVSVDDLKTGLYSFTIQVYDGNMQYTLSTEEPLYVKQSNALTKLEGIKVGSIDGEMFATWDARPDSTYMVTLYDYDTLAVLENKNTNNNFYSISLDNEHNMVKFSVAETNKYIYGDFDIFDIVRSTPVGVITFPDYSFTRENLISFSVTCPTDTTAGVYLDGALILENANAGIYDLHLAEGVHEILAYVKDNNGNIRTFSKTMMVDITPPAINLTNPNNVKTSDDNIIISGNTEPNAVVSINGVEQELGYGNFIVKLNIDKGVNVITVSAYDAAGNKNVKTITADRTNAFGSSWTEYIAPILLFVLLSAWYISLNKKAKEAKPNEEIN
ncbi:MAG: hypothetical protein GX896_00600 [Clostridiales bacterium]|nr:hypothetical protein [Clostridiales bacterium]